MSNSFVTIAMIVVLLLLVFFMFRNQRRRQRDAQQMQNQLVPGAEVMTNFGLFGTVVSIDEAENKVRLEISPGNIVTVHRQVVARILDSTAADAAGAATTSDAVSTANAEAKAEADRASGAPAGEPQFGERIDDARPSDDSE